ncbi:MAG: hypothetical protein ACTHZX_06445 [Microbacterium sp.]
MADPELLAIVAEAFETMLDRWERHRRGCWVPWPFPSLAHSEAPLVSADIVGDTHFAVFDAPLTQVVGDQVKVFAWDDNDWAFSHRLVELSERIAA